MAPIGSKTIWIMRKMLAATILRMLIQPPPVFDGANSCIQPQKWSIYNAHYHILERYSTIAVWGLPGIRTRHCLLAPATLSHQRGPTTAAITQFLVAPWFGCHGIHAIVCCLFWHVSRLPPISLDFFVRRPHR